MPEKLSRELIPDVPATDDLFKGKGHERIAMLLVDLIDKHKNDNLSIGLEGPWGIGKSSIIQMAEYSLNSEKFTSKYKYHIFTFDIWKSQGTEFRRSILEDFVNWSIETFPKKENELEKIQRDIRYTSKEIETATTPSLTWYATLMLISLPFLPVLYPHLIGFVKSSQAPNWTLISAITLYLITMLVLYPCWDYSRSRHKNMPKERFFDSYRARISKILVSPKQPLDHKTTHRIREINPTNFEFNLNINRVLSIIQSDTDRVILVLDNIDRLPNNEIMSYWSLIRSIISRDDYCRGQAKSTSLKTIVSYDRNLVFPTACQKNNGANGLNHLDNEDCKNLTPLPSLEIFTKTFHEVLTVAPPVLADAELFFRENLVRAVNFNIPKDHIFRCYKIFYYLLRSGGRKTTPRQIISFVNDLSRYFVLHRSEIQIPTIAAFLAHRDILINDPTILNDGNKLNREIVELASDPNLKRNLAAVVFNVDTEFAFQVLLDSQISDAAESENGDALQKLSQTVGFNLRVDDVVQDNINRWLDTSKLGTVIDNFSKCSQALSGERGLRYSTILIEAINSIDDVSLADDRYRSYFSALVFANPIQRDSIVRRIIQLSIIWTKNNLLAENGQQFVSFLMHLWELAESYGFFEMLKLELKKYHLVTSDSFLFELAGGIHKTKGSLHDFGSIIVKDYEQRNYMGQLMKSPLVAFSALVELQKGEFVTNEDWYSIGSGCLSTLKNEYVDPNHVIYLLDVVRLSLRFYNPTKHREIWVKGAFESGQFFRNIRLDDEERCKQAYSSAVFIAKRGSLNFESNSKILYNDCLVPADEFEEYVRFCKFYNQVRDSNEFHSDPIDEI